MRSPCYPQSIAAKVSTTNIHVIDNKLVFWRFVLCNSKICKSDTLIDFHVSLICTWQLPMTRMLIVCFASTTYNWGFYQSRVPKLLLTYKLFKKLQMWYKMHQFKLVDWLWTTQMFCCDDKSMNEEEAKVYALGYERHIWGREGPIKRISSRAIIQHKYTRHRYAHHQPHHGRDSRTSKHLTY